MHLTISSFAFPCLADISAYDTGVGAGQIVGIILLLSGIMKCIAISRRTTANPKCALALMFAFLPFLGSRFLLLAKPYVTSLPLRLVLDGVIVLCSGAFVIASIVLAIIGLVEMSNKPDEYTQGRSQAIWAFVLVALFVVTSGFGFVKGFKEARTRMQERLASRSEQVDDARAASIPGSTGTPAGKILTFEDLNFQIRTPDRPWVAFNAERLNKNARVAFIRTSPNVYFMIIPEKISAAKDFDCDQLAEIGKAHLNSAADSCRVIEENRVTQNGLSGLMVETEAKVQGLSAYYQHWYIVTNGYAYQLVGYGRWEDRAKISNALPEVIRGFSLLDPGHVAFPNTGGFTTNFTSPLNGYSVIAARSTWGPYASMAKDLPQAEFGASCGDSCFVVVPVTIPDENPELENLTTGLLAMLGINYPDEDLKNRTDYIANGLVGVKYDYERTVDKSRLRYRLGILRGRESDYLVAAWTRRWGREANQVLDDAFSRVQFGSNSNPSSSATRQFTARELKTRGFVLNHAALANYKASDYEEALRQFRAAARANPAEKLYVVNALLTWNQLQRPNEALEFIDSQSSAILQKPEVRAWQAYFQAEASKTSEALTNYAALFAQDYRDDTHFTRYVRLLNAQHRYGDSLAAIASYQKKEDSIPTRLLEAETYRLKSDFPKAASLLKQLHARAPYNLQVAGGLAETALAAGSYNDALDASRDMVAKNSNSPYALYLKGRSELGLKWYREAKTSFDAAAKLAPSDKTISSYVDLANGMLGEGNNSVVRESIDPVGFPPSWSKTSPTVPVGYATNYGAYYLQRALAISWKPGHEYKSTEFFRVRVLDSAGVAAFSTIQRRFDPAGQQLFVNDLRVLDRNGQLVSKGNLANYYVLDEHRGDIASHRKVLNIPVPGLQPGYQVVATITHRELGRLTEFPFFEYPFSTEFPVRQSMVLLMRPATDVKYKTSPAIEPEKLTEGLCWRWTDPLVAHYEPLQSPLETFAPVLWLSDKSASWNGIATEYLGSLSDRMKADGTVTEQARKLTAYARSPEAKTSAIAAYVQTNYTYKAIEFGRRARIPNTPAEVISNKYGDCKDHALLLQQMLTAVGVTARLALVASTGPVEQDLPSLDQFNHMIVFVPGGKGMFIDTTDKGGNPISGSPAGLAERDAFILDVDNPRFAKIPTPAPDSYGIELERRLRLEGEETLLCEDTITARGTHAAYLRNFFQSVPAASRKMSFQQQMGMADVDLTELTAEPVEIPGVPLKVHCSYTLKKQFHRSNGQISGLLRAPIEHSYLAAIQVDNRLTPFEIRVPTQLKSTVSIEVPEGFAAEVPANPTSRLDPRFATCTNSWRLDGRTLVADFECREAAGKFGASDYNDFRETMSRSLSLLEKEIVFHDVQRASK